MKTEVTSINDILTKNNTSFFIPPFQRSYAWGGNEINRFYADLSKIIESELDVTEKNKQEHFFGTIVIKAESCGFGTKSIIVDGQQRLTTTLLFLIALRDSIDDEKIKKKITKNYLCNEESDFPDKIKLKQVSKDWDSYRALINGKTGEAKGQIKIAYDRFYRLIALNSNFTLDNYITALRRLNVAIIFLDERPYKGEDPQIIFETLNSLGKPLSLSDLIRNYVLLKMGSENQTKIYDEIWYPKIEKVFGDNTSKFLRDFLQYKKSLPVKTVSDNNTKEIYKEFKDFIVDNYQTSQDFIDDIIKYVDPYKWMIFEEYSDKISSDAAKDKEIKELLRNIFHDIKSDSFKSFVLGLLFSFDQKKMTEEFLIDNLKIIRTYLIRRRVLRLTQAENKNIPLQCKRIEEILHGTVTLWDIFTSLFYKMRFPNDTEVMLRLTEIDFYNDLKNYTKFILGKIEEYNSKVAVDFRDEKITIEHIMPQTLTDKWKNELGSNYQDIHKRFLHNIGNLILTEFNSEMGNKKFEEKKNKLKTSNLHYRVDILYRRRWDEKALEEHQEKMINDFLQTFSLPEEFQNAPNWSNKDEKDKNGSIEVRPFVDEGDDDVKGSKPFKLIIGENEYEIKTWQDVYLTFMRYVHSSNEYDFEILMLNQEELFGRADAIVLWKVIENLGYEDRRKYETKYKTMYGKFFYSGIPLTDNTLFFHINISADMCLRRIANMMQKFGMDQDFVKVLCR